MSGVYQVEKVIGKKKMHGKVHYRIKWKGYPVEESTWEPRSSCHCKDMIKAFEARLKRMQSGEVLEVRCLFMGRETTQIRTLYNFLCSVSNVSSSSIQSTRPFRLPTPTKLTEAYFSISTLQLQV